MMRNDYRRALILLRSNATGYSGHVRLERRTLMGSMYFLMQAPQECTLLRAALVGRDKNGYYACALGEARRDARGQAAMTCSFDPRRICNRELEQYQLLAVTCGEESCDVVLYGNVAGHADLNWERVRAALCALYAGDEAQEEAAPPAAQLPAPEEIVPEAVLPQPDEPPAGETLTQEEETQGGAGMSMESGAPEQAQPDAPEIRMAGELLEVDMNLPWPENIEPLRPLFAVSVPMENPPDEEYVYIAVAMPEGSGYAHCAVGVLARDGVPASVRYGMPAAWSAEAPAGLEDYSWVGDQNRGWWMTQVDLYGCGGR